MAANYKTLSLLTVLGLMACQPETVQNMPTPAPSVSAPSTPTAEPEPEPTPEPTAIPIPTQEPSTPPEPTATPEPSPTPTPAPETTFLALTTDDLEDIKTYLPEFIIGEERLPEAEEEAILNDIFIENPEDLESLLGINATVTEPGPLRYDGKHRFGIQAVNVAEPNAWIRQRTLTEQRVRVRRRADNGQINLWLVREFDGNLTLDLDGDERLPSATAKPFKERFVQRFVVSRPENRWVIVQTSHAVTIPDRALSTRLPLIRKVVLSQAENGTEIIRMQQPLSTFERLIIPPLSSGTKLRLTAEILSRDDTYEPQEFVHVYAFGERHIMFDNGQFGDQNPRDHIYTLDFRAPDNLSGFQHIAVDTIGAHTFVDETTPNYHSMAWTMHLSSVTSP